jgi:hypothetical protein
MTSARGLATILCGVLLAGLGGCSLPGTGGCGHVDVGDREGPAGIVAIDSGHYSTQRYRTFVVYLPGATGPAQVTAANPRVVRLGRGSIRQATKPARWTTTAWPLSAGRTTLRMTSPDTGRTYRLRVKVAC